MNSSCQKKEECAEDDFICLHSTEKEKMGWDAFKHFIFIASNHFTTLYMFVLAVVFDRRLFPSCFDSFVLYP